MPRPDRSTSNASTGGKKGGKAAKGAASDRQARVAAIQKQATAKNRRSTSVIWVALGLVLVLVAGLVTWAIIDQNNNRPDLGATVTYDELDDPSDDLGRNHVQTAVEYQQDPPVGGDHHPTWLNCGIYDEPVPNHHAVHSLEHGAIWLTYQPDIPEADLDALRDLANQEFVLLSPYPDQEYPVMATAWGRQLGVEDGDDTRLEAFIREWRQGPQTPEPGAACSGGTSTDLVRG